MLDFRKIEIDVYNASIELINLSSNLNEKDIFYIGCSTSEIVGLEIGTNSNMDIAKSVFNGVYRATSQNNLYLAAGCCEHLNRSVVIEKDAMKQFNYEIVNAIPKLSAGGGFATYCYENLKNPVLVEKVKCNVGMDIGDTLIGMNIQPVAVPIRVKVKKIGEANLVCAKSRPKFVGGERTMYNKNLL